MKITQARAKKLGDGYKLNFKVVPLREFWLGLNIELEHTELVNNDIDSIVKITLVHLEEDPRYYFYLHKIEEERKKYWRKRTKPSIFI